MPLHPLFDPRRALASGSRELAPTPDLALARATLLAFQPYDAEQAIARERMLSFIDSHPTQAHLRSLAPGHLTASALVLDSTHTRALLTHHKKLGRWLQLGGHCDGDSNLPGVALREAIEESGISDLCILPEPIDLDIHAIPALAGEPEHLHLDTRFLVFSPAGAVPSAGEESRALGWFSPAELEGLETDRSVRRLFELAFA